MTDTLPRPVESQVLEFIQAKLLAIPGPSASFYKPDHVWIVDEPELPMLSDSWDLTMFVYPGDGIFTPETGRRVESKCDFYVMAALTNRSSSSLPQDVDDGKEPPHLKLKLFADIRAAIMGAPAPGFAQHLYISDRNLRIYAPGFHLLQVQGVFEFSEIW